MTKQIPRHVERVPHFDPPKADKVCLTPYIGPAHLALRDKVWHPTRRLVSAAGTTLVETMVAMTIMTVLLGAMGSAVVLATKALPNPDSPTGDILDSTRVLDRITGELRYAINFTERSLNAVQFTLADRTGDSVSETVRYQWAGTVGDPLTRQYNGGTPVNLLDSVEQFDLAYNIKTVVDTSAVAPMLEGPETVVLQQDDPPTGALYGIGNSGGISEYFEPTLPAGTASWRITRVQFMGQKSGGPTATIAVDVREADGSEFPTATVIDTVNVLEANLIAGQWHEITYANATNLNPTLGYHITFTKASGGGGAGDLMTSNPSILPETRFFTSNDGVSWAEDPEDLWLWVWGVALAPDPAWTPPTTDTLHSINVTLQASSNTATRMQVDIPVLNQPQVGP